MWTIYGLCDPVAAIFQLAGQANIPWKGVVGREVLEEPTHENSRWCSLNQVDLRLVDFSTVPLTRGNTAGASSHLAWERESNAAMSG